MSSSPTFVQIPLAQCAVLLNMWISKIRTGSVGLRADVLVNNRAEGNAPLTVQVLVDQMRTYAC